MNHIGQFWNDVICEQPLTWYHYCQMRPSGLELWLHQNSCFSNWDQRVIGINCQNNLDLLKSEFHILLSSGLVEGLNLFIPLSIWSLKLKFCEEYIGIFSNGSTSIFHPKEQLITETKKKPDRFIILKKINWAPAFTNCWK